MKIISAIGSFKGSADSREINALVKNELEKHGFSVRAISVSDGGDGLLGSLCDSLGGRYLETDTVNALGEPIKARVATVGTLGIAEMALASGVAILDESRLNPMKASTYGTGLLIKHLADEGVSDIILGIGGSATNDGGFGCLAALGFRFYGDDGTPVSPSGENLALVRTVDGSEVPEKIKKLRIKIACDVTNPLLGKSGATYVYAPQKGADETMLPILEEGMKSFAKAVADYCGEDFSSMAGAGAAGGLGFGLGALMGARLERGARIVLDCAHYGEYLKDADLVITGEGRLDSQTVYGKLPQIIAGEARERSVKCIALVGSSCAGEEALESMGISKVYQLTDYAPVEKCMTRTKEVIKTALKAIAEDII